MRLRTASVAAALTVAAVLASSGVALADGHGDASNTEALAHAAGLVSGEFGQAPAYIPNNACSTPAAITAVFNSTEDEACANSR
ncbi:chaplin [Streptomyces sp. NBC_00656]|uniref:chaplin family protein n=1 Tax=Streptomyces sp. NBC_00656 TaxID=2903668 RepID=UPI0032546FF8